VGPLLRWAPTLSDVDQLLLADAQTSGGVLIAVAPDRADELVRLLEAGDALAAAVVGEVAAGDPSIEILDQ
jgi:selenide,water dikinase